MNTFVRKIGLLTKSNKSTYAIFARSHLSVHMDTVGPRLVGLVRVVGRLLSGAEGEDGRPRITLLRRVKMVKD